MKNPVVMKDLAAMKDPAVMKDLAVMENPAVMKNLAVMENPAVIHCLRAKNTGRRPLVVIVKVVCTLNKCSRVGNHRIVG